MMMGRQEALRNTNPIILTIFVMLCMVLVMMMGAGGFKEHQHHHPHRHFHARHGAGDDDWNDILKLLKLIFEVWIMINDD